SYAATEIKIPSIPKGDVVERKYIFHGPLNAIKICQKIQRKARILDLHGEIKKTDEHSIKVERAMDKVSDYESCLKGKEKDKIIVIHREIEKTEEYDIKMVGAKDKESDFESFLQGKEKDKIISKLEQKKAIEPVNVGFVVKV